MVRSAKNISFTDTGAFDACILEIGSFLQKYPEISHTLIVQYYPSIVVVPFDALSIAILYPNLLDIHLINFTCNLSINNLLQIDKILILHFRHLKRLRIILRSSLKHLYVLLPYKIHNYELLQSLQQRLCYLL